ncbi:PEGA domain-containing protein [Sorangium sp. So ce291]|uniref:PEGA domain-containing protein n=1 Tax=Sorangium sp. So ce291 TaxID=3133294 RepID=UPI003F60A894
MMLAEARAKYEEALAAWEHPELRLYLGRVLKSMGLPLPAHDNLRLSLRWGPGSLDPEIEQEARAAMRALVEQELAVIQVRSDEPGATVLLDGNLWFLGPGAERRTVMPGEHIVTARKNGYFTIVKPITVLTGKEASIQVDLRVDAAVTRQRWPAWVPWTTLGAGVILGVAGGGLMWHARANEPSCAPWCTAEFADEHDRRLLENGLGIGALVAGGAMVTTGTVLLFMNRPVSYRTEDRGGVKLEIQPAASLDAASLSARVVF